MLLNSRQLRQALVDAWVTYVDDKIKREWNAYLFTFTFNKLPGRERALLEQMRNEIERVYATLITQVAQKPTSVNWQHKLPILIASPDFAGSRHGRITLQELTVNGGLHYHAVVLIPPVSCLDEDLTEHMPRKYSAYLGQKNRINTIDVQRITYAPGSAVEYSLKAFKSGRFSDDHLLVLPKALSELPKKKNTGGHI
jgi:hypothetical protein